MNTFNKMKAKIINEIFYAQSKKISLFLRSMLKGKKISIFDIGAGNRYLPILLNFDGTADISLIDPHRSLFWSYENLKKKFIYKDCLKTYQLAIGDKTEVKNFYVGKKSTGSTFINIFENSKKKKTKLNMNYFSKGVEKVKVYNTKEFLKKFKVQKPEIVKIDVEGLEDKVLKSILKVSKPIIIQTETNINSNIYENTFNDIHHTLTSKGYYLATFHPIFNIDSYASTNNKIFTNYYDYPVVRSIITQSDNIYILKKNNSLRKILILIGYGFVLEAFKALKEKRRIDLKDKQKFQKFFKIIIPKKILIKINKDYNFS